MGNFHSICNLLSTIGKLFGDAGLRDLAVESGVIVEGSIDNVLDGKQYNRAVRLHKLIYEALIRLAWSGFEEWLEANHTEALPKYNDTIYTIICLKSVCLATFADCRSQFLLDRLGRCLKLIVSYTSSHLSSA